MIGSHGDPTLFTNIQATSINRYMARKPLRGMMTTVSDERRG